MINFSNESHFLIFNPDTLWSKEYKEHIQNMEKFYFLNQIKNILLLVNKDLSFDKNLLGDFNLLEKKVKKNIQNNFIYTGCQIINKNLFKNYSLKNFSISEIWSETLDKNELYGYQSYEKFYHLTNLEVYKKLLEKK